MDKSHLPRLDVALHHYSFLENKPQILSFIGIKTPFSRKSGSQVGIAAHQPAFRTVRESCPFIRLKPLPGTFPHPASLRLTAGDAPVCDNWGGEGASWRDCPCHRRPDREYDERAIHSLW